MRRHSLPARGGRHRPSKVRRGAEWPAQLCLRDALDNLLNWAASRECISHSRRDSRAGKRLYSADARAETLQTNVLVGRGEDGQDETWALTPARWPLPRHCFARIFFIARAFSHVGPLLKRQGRENPLRPWGQRRGDRRRADSHWTAEPAIGVNSQVKAKNRHQGVPGYMRGSSHASRMKSSNAK